MGSSGERLRKLLESKGVTQKELAKYLDVTKQYVSNLCNDRSVLGKAQATSIANYFGVPVSWLLFGEGDIPLSEQDNDTVPVVNMYTLGGSLTEQLDAQRVSTLTRVSSPVAGAEMVIEVSGDSMAPDYPNGSRLFCRRIDESLFIEWGRVYVVDTTSGAIVKKLQPGKTSDSIKCISINSGGNYAPFEVPKSAIRSIWKILGVFILK